MLKWWWALVLEKLDIWIDLYLIVRILIVLIHQFRHFCRRRRYITLHIRIIGVACRLTMAFLHHIFLQLFLDFVFLALFDLFWIFEQFKLFNYPRFNNFLFVKRLYFQMDWILRLLFGNPPQLEQLFQLGDFLRGPQSFSSVDLVQLDVHLIKKCFEVLRYYGCVIKVLQNFQLLVFDGLHHPLQPVWISAHFKLVVAEKSTFLTDIYWASLLTIAFLGCRAVRSESLLPIFISFPFWFWSHAVGIW